MKRDGISYKVNRDGKANNEFMKNYGQKAPSKYIMYLDANNLYSWAMSQYLPIGGFRWMTEEAIDKLNLSENTEDSRKELILEDDTDSLTYEIETEDVYQDFWNDENKFDNCDYNEHSPYFDKTDKKVLGECEDEASGMPVVEFIGLRSKMYSYMRDDEKGGKTAKGIKKNVMKKDIKHENYKTLLFNKKQIFHKRKTIRSSDHQLGRYKLNEVSLSCFDDKRYILEYGTTSCAYGHYKIQN